jgi:hypothetical protein
VCKSNARFVHNTLSGTHSSFSKVSALVHSPYKTTTERLLLRMYTPLGGMRHGVAVSQTAASAASQTAASQILKSQCPYA